MNLLPYNRLTSHPRQVPLTTLEAEALEVSQDLALPFGDAKRLVLTMRYALISVEA